MRGDLKVYHDYGSYSYHGNQQKKTRLNEVPVPVSSRHAKPETGKDISIRELKV